MTTSYSGDAFYSEYLEHHGILGMKWGVRRWQNKDGTLTPAGQKRYSQVANSERLSKKDTKDYKKILIENKYDMDVRSAQVSKRIESLDKSIQKYKAKQEEYDSEGNIEKSEKMQTKISKKSKELLKVIEYKAYFNAMSKLANQKLSDINEGKIQAGKDFIVQRDWNINPVIIPGVGGMVGVSRTKTIIEKPKE